MYIMFRLDHNKPRYQRKRTTRWTCGLNHCCLSLNHCVFFDECFRLFDEVDYNAEFIFSGVRDGFAIEDSTFDGSYFCENYDSISKPEFRSQMDDTFEKELEQGKVSLVDVCSTCVHALGAISKSDGSLRPITDCKIPIGTSINSFMETTYCSFSYTK